MHPTRRRSTLLPSPPTCTTAPHVTVSPGGQNSLLLHQRGAFLLQCPPAARRGPLSATASILSEPEASGFILTLLMWPTECALCAARDKSWRGGILHPCLIHQDLKGENSTSKTHSGVNIKKQTQVKRSGVMAYTHPLNISFNAYSHEHS